MKRRNRALWISAAAICSGAALIYIASTVSSLAAFKITEVRISGVESEGEQLAIRAAALESLEGKYLGLFSRANTLTYPERTIVAQVKDSIVAAERVSVEREGMHALNVSVQEREPAALVCTTLPDFNGTDLSLDDPGSCYFADEMGYLFRKAPSFTGTLYHRYYVPDLVPEASSTDTIVGWVATSTDEFKSLEKLYDIVSESGIVVDAILFKPGYEYELYARNLISSGDTSSNASTIVIYFNTSSSLEEQTSNLVSFWKHMTEDARAKKKSLRFDSIDVRYGANIFYRESK